MHRAPQIRIPKCGSVHIVKHSLQPMHFNQLRTFRTSTTLNLRLQRRPLSEPKGSPFTYTVTNPTIAITRNKAAAPEAISPARQQEQELETLPTLTVMRRIETGRKFTKQFIQQGLVPGVVVGAGKKPVAIVMKKGDIERQSKHLPFVNRPYYLEIDGEKELVRVRMMTYQGANDKYHNVIFQRTPLIFGTKPYNKTEGSDLERESEMLRVAYGMEEWNPRDIKFKVK